MTDYDAPIARLKTDAMRALKTNVHLPFAVSAGDAPGAWDAILNKVLAPTLAELMSALIMRDTWEARTDRKQEQIDRWIRSCLEVQTMLEQANRRIGELEDQVDVERAALELKDMRILELERAQVQECHDHNEAIKALTQKHDALVKYRGIIKGIS